MNQAQHRKSRSQRRRVHRVPSIPESSAQNWCCAERPGWWCLGCGGRWGSWRPGWWCPRWPGCWCPRRWGTPCPERRGWWCRGAGARCAQNVVPFMPWRLGWLFRDCCSHLCALLSRKFGQLKAIRVVSPCGADFREGRAAP